MATKAEAPPSATDLVQVAVGNHDYGTKAAEKGHFDVALSFLRTACRLMPFHLPFRQTLRRVARSKYKNNKRGSFFAPLTTWRTRLKLWSAKRNSQHLLVLDYGEAILTKNPWDQGVQLIMAEALVALERPVLAMWILEQSRESNEKNATINRALARLYENQGVFTRAIALWELVRRAVPGDQEAADKVKSLAVSETIAKGGYEDAVQADGSVRPLNADAANVAADDPEARVAQHLANIEANPNKPEGYLQLAGLHRRQGEWNEARTILNKGLAACETPGMRLLLEEVELELYRQKLARTESKLETDPDDAKRQVKKKKILETIAGREIAYLRHKLEINAQDKTTRFELGLKLLEGGQPELAITEFQALRNDVKLQGAAHLQLGRCFKKCGNRPLARRNYESALQLLSKEDETQRKEAMFELACDYAETEELAKAIEVALDLANLDYGYEQIGQRLSEWQKRAK
jgi:Tfp pilus assembly protein PilF